MTWSKWSKFAIGTGLLALVIVPSLGLASAGDSFSNLPPEKQDLERQVADLEARGRALAVPKTPENGRHPAPQPEPPMPEGVFQEQDAPFPPSVHKVHNRWQGMINGDKVVAFAGVEGQDREQGFVAVVVEKPDRSKSGEFYYTPSKSGAVKVLSESGSKLTLQADDGTEFTFDLLTRAFVEP